MLAATALLWGMGEADRSVRQGWKSLPVQIEWFGVPDWLSDPGGARALEEIKLAAGVRAEEDADDPELCERVASGLRQCPWVAEVHRVSKHVNDVGVCVVRVQASYRDPFAYVEWRDRAHLVDGVGVRLPVECNASLIDPTEAFVITGVSEPPPPTGQPWPGDDLTAGLRLVQVLKDATVRGELPFRSSLRAIDVAKFRRRESAKDGDLRIRTVQPRSYIVWGEPPGDVGVEASPARKLGILRSYYADNGGQLPDGYVYDVRGADGIRRWEYRGG